MVLAKKGEQQAHPVAPVLQPDCAASKPNKKRKKVLHESPITYSSFSLSIALKKGVEGYVSWRIEHLTQKDKKPNTFPTCPGVPVQAKSGKGKSLCVRSMQWIGYSYATATLRLRHADSQDFFGDRSCAIKLFIHFPSHRTPDFQPINLQLFLETLPRTSVQIPLTTYCAFSIRETKRGHHLPCTGSHQPN